MEGFLNQQGRIKNKKSNAVCVCECVFTKKEELAAVTVPWGLIKAGFSLLICSIEDGRIPLSWETIVRPGKRKHLLILVHK